MVKIINLKGGQLAVGRTELDVPKGSNVSTFVLPLMGPGYHETVMKEVDSKDLYRPTTAEVLSLVDVALQNPDEPHCAEVIEKFKVHCLCTATESLSFPDGVLVYDNIDGKMPQTVEGLTKLLNEGDKRVRFVKPGFKTGYLYLPDFLENPYTIAQIGEDMIETAERVAKTFHKTEAYVKGLDREYSETKRLTSLSASINDPKLILNGNWSPAGDSYGSYGYTSGKVK